MTILNEEKPSLESVIEHHGVKGQKWGVRKAKPSDSDIQNARARIGSQTRQINSQIDKTNLSSGKQQEKEAKKLADLHSSFLKNPDRETALRMTKGEKRIALVATVIVPPYGLVVASQVSQRRAVSKYLDSQGIH